jgi:hypothetical protein
MATYLAAPKASHHQYLLGRRKLPLSPPTRPITLADHMFDQLKLQCPDPPHRAKIAHKLWLSEDTIKLMDTRCSLCRNPKYDVTICHQLDQKIKRAIHKGRRQCTIEARESIESALAGDNFNQKKAYGILKKGIGILATDPQSPATKTSSQQQLNSKPYINAENL